MIDLETWKTISTPLRESLENYNLNEVTDIYTTSDLLYRIKQNKIQEADINVIMMGTNDIRTGHATTANKNLREIADLLISRT